MSQGLNLGDPGSHARGPELLDEDPGNSGVSLRRAGTHPHRRLSPHTQPELLRKSVSSWRQVSPGANLLSMTYPCHSSLVSSAHHSVFIEVSTVCTGREVTWDRSAPGQ